MGTLAAAQIGLVRAGQKAARSPDSVRASALVEPAALSARECRKPVVRARENGETMTTRATASAGKGQGDCPRRGVGKGPRPAGRWTYGRGEPTPGGRPPLPLGRWWPAVTRQPAPFPRVKQRLTGEHRAVRVQ